MLVCDDPNLRALDAEPARLRAEVEAGPACDPAAAQAQEAWFRERSLCAFEEDHRGRAYSNCRARMAALRAAKTSL